jgi:radical SAM superfamily enzyme YgiQ (UPF0313 family)
MMKSVVLVSLDWQRPEDGKTSLGIASIAAALKVAGVCVNVVEDAVNDPQFDLEHLLQRLLHTIDKAGPDCLVGFGVYVWNDAEVCWLIHQLRQFRVVQVVLGGPQISYMPTGELEAAYPEVDFFVRGQGEMAMVKIAWGDDLSECGVHIPGTADQGLKADHELLRLPSPFLNGVLEPAASMRWETQRGCPFKCSFCQHREPGNRLLNQLLDSHRLDQEVQWFAQHGVQRISVLDPIFHAKPGWAIERLNAIKRAGLEAHLAFQCRFEMITDEFLDALSGLNVTLEFGLQTAMAVEGVAIDRPNNMAKVDAAIRKLHARAIDFEVSLIYGLPLQTLESFRESVSWCLQRQVPRIKAWPLMLLRGTPLYKQKAQYGFMESTDLRIPLVIASNSFSETDYVAMQQLAATL